MKYAMRVCALVLGITMCGSLIALAAVPVEDRMAEYVQKITRACAQSYPREYAERFIELGGKVTNPKGTFGISIKLHELLVPVFREFLKPGQKFIDLGSGDGRVVLLASLFGVDAYGIEYDGTLRKISQEARKRLSKKMVDPKRVHFVQGDFFEMDLSSYDVLYCNFGIADPLPMMEKIDREAAPGSILIMYWMPEDVKLKNFQLLEGALKFREVKSNFRIFQKPKPSA